MKKPIDENYIVVQGWMVTSLGLKSHELLCYALLYGFSQANQGRFTGSLKYLQSWLSCSQPTAINTLKSLVEKGFIAKHEIFKNGVKFNEYETLDPLKNFKHPPLKNFSTPPKNSLDNNTSNINYKETDSNSLTLFEKNQLEIPFDKFWELYDKKVGKVKAEKLWQKIKPKDKEEILKVLPAYISAHPDKMYRKDPATFLNQRSWEDEIIKPEKALHLEPAKNQSLKSLLNGTNYSK